MSAFFVVFLWSVAVVHALLCDVDIAEMALLHIDVLQIWYKNSRK